MRNVYKNAGGDSLLWSGTTPVPDCGSISHIYRTGWCNGNNTQISVLEVAGTNLGYFTCIPS